MALVGDHLMNELQLAHRGTRQDERVVIRLAHAARQLVEHVGQADPAVQEVQELHRVRMVGLPQVGGLEQIAGEFGTRRVHAEAHGGICRVGHVQVVRPGFGPVLPRMRTGVAGHETVAPIGDRALLVMRLEGGGVVGAFVAEQRAIVFQPVRRIDQQVPVVVADLVPEMPHQRSIRFPHLGANALAHCVFRFLCVEGDDAVFMARQHMRAAGHVAQEVEGEPVDRVGMAAHHRQAEREQLRDEAPLRLLELPPEHAIAFDGKIGDGARDAARKAVPGREAGGVETGVVALTRRGHHPVAAGRCHQIGATAISLAVGVAEHGVRIGLCALKGRGRERHHAQALDDVTERRMAGEAFAVAEKDRTAALALVGAAERRRLEIGGERVIGLLGSLIRRLHRRVLRRRAAGGLRWEGLFHDCCSSAHGRGVGDDSR